MSNNFNPFAMATQQLKECARIMNLSSDAYELLRYPAREVHVSIPVRMDDGSIRVFPGFRVQYNWAKGPTKGGIRFHPQESIDTIRALAAWMTWKTALLNLPLGGAKGGVICNPKEMSINELERLSRGYIDKVYEFIGPDKDVPAPDVYTDSRIMAWMMDEYSKLCGKNQFGVITGKPLSLGGSAGRMDATARGAVATIKEAAQVLGLDLKKARVAVHGYGNAGYFTAKLLKEVYGSKIVAIADSKGCVIDEDGFDPEEVIQYKAQTSSVKDFPGAQSVSSKEALEFEADILLAAALEGSITEDNAPRIKAKILAELANGPTTMEADSILFGRGVHIIPDFLCNAGGVTVSYFEMVQNAYMYYWDDEKVYSRLDKKMTAAYHEVLKTSQKMNINMRQAAYVVAVEKVVQAMKDRGWI